MRSRRKERVLRAFLLIIVSLNVFYLSFQSFIHLLGHSVIGDYAMQAAGIKSRSSALFSGVVFASLASVFMFRLGQEIWQCCCRKNLERSKPNTDKKVPAHGAFNAIFNFIELFSIGCAHNPFYIV